MKSLKIIIQFLTFLIMYNCSPSLDLKGKNISEERIQLVKTFANDFFEKCEKKDYSEMQGYKVDINLKNKLTSENIRKNCEYYENKYGTVTIGRLCEAKTYYSQKNFLDYFTFYAKGSKNDSIQFVRVNIYRDNNMLERISIPRYRAIKTKR